MTTEVKIPEDVTKLAERSARSIWSYFHDGHTSGIWFDNNKHLGGPSHLIRTISSAIMADRAGLEKWLPIETAPKDGTEIDLYLSSQDRVTNCKWNDFRNRWEHWWISDFGRMDMVAVDGIPTHWCYVPAAPRMGGEHGQ